MTKLLVLLCCVVLLAAMGAATASAPSFFGPTGLIAMPTADTLDQGKLEAFANYLSREDYDETPYGLNFGLGYGVELGVTSIHETGASTETIFNVKWTALQETAVRPAVAIGAVNATTNKDFRGSIIVVKEDGEMCPYVVASKKLALPGSDLALSAHAGYIGGIIDGVMLGANAQVSPKLELMADYVSHFSDLSVGARYQATDSLSANVSLLDGDFVIGTRYTFGLK